MTAAIGGGGTARKRKLKRYTFGEFRALTAKERDGWRWDGLLPASGTMLLVGQPHAGKTTLVAALAAAMSGSRELAGRRVKTGRMLLVSLEHQGRDLVKALAAAARGAGVKEDDLQVEIVRAPLDLDNDDEVAALGRSAKAAKAQVIVIDPLRRSTRIDENRAEDVSAYCKSLQRLTRNGRRLVIVIHHLTKNGDLPRGSMDFIASTDSWMRVTRTKKDVVTIEATHHGSAPISMRLVVSRDDDKLIVDEEPDGTAMVPDKLKDCVLRAIENKANMGRRMLRIAVRSMFKASHDLIDRAADELAAEKRIENVGVGNKHRWVLLPAK
jgi:hypothetical protein